MPQISKKMWDTIDQIGRKKVVNGNLVLLLKAKSSHIFYLISIVNPTIIML